MDNTGSRAYQECIIWALRVVTDARQRKDVVGPEVADLSNRLIELRTSIASLYHYQFQVIPFVYVHMISLVSTIYGVAYSLHQGLGYSPDEGPMYGVVFPLITVFLMTASLVGLLDIGHMLASAPSEIECRRARVFPPWPMSEPASEPALDRPWHTHTHTFYPLPPIGCPTDRPSGGRDGRLCCLLIPQRGTRAVASVRNRV